ncbi:MAG: sulfatase-like hydrolase/transferase [Bacteroidia bacterium]|nr:sulfatase-like hydrolase/transferase [Bacteroidia bacterium]
MRTTTLLAMISLLLACNSPERSAKASTEADLSSKPNILLILTDDQGYHDVSYYGTEDIRTPYLDEMAAAGMRFDNFYANCPVCSPTRAALLSGRYQEFVGVPGVIRTYDRDNWGHLDPEAKLISDELKEEGYHTALVGKWHLGLESPNTPPERGFDYFHGWLGDMMEDYTHKRRHGINYMRRDQDSIDPAGHATDVFTDWAVKYVEEQAENDQAFFLYLAYNAPHFPVQPKEDWLAKVKEREPQLSDKRAELVAFIEHLDDGIGQVVEALKKSGQYENTIIVFSSDNGGLLGDAANNGPLRDGKQSVYEGGLKVPTFISWEGKIKAGTTTDYRALSMDLYPTLLDLIGGKMEHAIEGKSFAKLLLGEDMSDADRPLFFSRREGGRRYGGLTIQAVQLNGWKLLQNSPFAPQELYYLPEDPLEENNLIEEETDKYQELNALLMKHLQKAGQVPWQRAE